MFDPKVILVLAPHTDDGELGCGGSIARFLGEGKEVHYVAFSSCVQSVPPGLPPDILGNECKEATKILGIKEEFMRLLDFPVRTFPAYRQEILEEMVELNKQINPDLVLAPCSTDRHQDHATVCAEAARAFNKTSLLGYELPWNQTQVTFNCFTKITAEQLALKVNALMAYHSQSKRAYMQESFIRSLATVRGVQAGCDYAEAFEVCRIKT
jgi:LmbE family N-acetylglucosaminyl deacetylase